MKQILRGWHAIRSHPTLAISSLFILTLIGISIYAPIWMPLSEAIELWNADPEVWAENPLNAPPAWTNLVRSQKLPESFAVCTQDFDSSIELVSDAVWLDTKLVHFEYPYTGLPQDVMFDYTLRYGAKRPLLTITWIKPDGSELQLHRSAAHGGFARLPIEPAAAFGMPESAVGADQSTDASPQEGTYTLRIEAMLFDEQQGYAVDGVLRVRGNVHGIAGTDSQRRDLLINLVWGTPIALGVGLLAAVITTVISYVMAAIGAWYGGWIDGGIQRLTDISMMIPLVPCIAIVGEYYSSRLWVLVAFLIAFNLFGSPLKTYRAMFLQVVESQYIEGARAYGASNLRIIFRYLIPHMAPVALPRLILGVPLFVFLEASLALLGVSDPSLPTWGKLLSGARHNLYMGHYHTVLGVALLLMLTGVSFAMFGYTLDRLFNPKLREF